MRGLLNHGPMTTSYLQRAKAITEGDLSFTPQQEGSLCYRRMLSLGPFLHGRILSNFYSRYFGQKTKFFRERAPGGSTINFSLSDRTLSRALEALKRGSQVNSDITCEEHKASEIELWES